MDEAALKLSGIYLGAFQDQNQWTQEDHLNGLKAVFQAGAAAANKKPEKI